MSDDASEREQATRRADDRLGGTGLASGFDAPAEEVMATYDEWAESGAYDDDVVGWGYRIPERLAAIVLHAIGPTGSVLDAGCGTGLAGQALRDAGFTSVIGGDFSASSRQLAAERGVYDDVVHLDLNDELAIDDARFDAVISAGVFTYVTDGDAALRELLRVTVVDGVVAFSQRTDLWEQRRFADTIECLVVDDLCTADVSEPVPYLPGHPDFGDELGVRIVTLHRTATPIIPRGA